ncbi:hypothetical protein [Lysobacter sp. 1R34A]|uniref:hypothetical protein n=1 Tax=Lysobacter sp. 1R34A TaxID=3445786 RepID=UPI003EF03F83
MSYSVSGFEDTQLSGQERFDLMIFAVTGETRGWTIPEMFLSSNAAAWVLARHNKNLAADRLDKQIEARLPSFTVLREGAVKESLDGFIAARKSSTLKVFIDVTCMPRVDMGMIFQEIRAAAARNALDLDITVGYVLGEFSPPPVDLQFNEYIRPITPSFAGWPVLASAPTTLVVGLGYERGKADGACEYFDSSESWIFSPQSPIAEYDNAVYENNRQIVDRSSRQGRLIGYQVDRPSETFGKLGALISDQVAKANPVILPFGPKVFFAMSLLIAFVYREVGVWHATGDNGFPEIDHTPSEHIISFSVQMQYVATVEV